MTEISDPKVREGYATLYEAVLKACAERGIDEETATDIAVKVVEIVQAGNMTPRQDCR